MHDNDYRVVGKPVPRIDGKVKVTGTATFADDLFMPRMLHGKLLRSPYAHAKIKNIDTRKAEKLPGVRAVITGKDFPGIVVGFMKQYADRPPIAFDKVRHYGEAVAAVAAEDEDTAEDALDQLRQNQLVGAVCARVDAVNRQDVIAFVEQADVV